jgi:DNA-binding CsgD family transcriptional regulator
VFISDYGNFLTEKSAGDVEIFEGSERANQRMQRFQPTKSIWGLLVADTLLRSDFENSPDRVHLDRGVEIRYLFPESFFRKSGVGDFIVRMVEFGGKVRITPSVPFRLIIFDNEAAVMGIDPEDSSIGAVVHHSNAVVRLATEIFQQFWRTARDPFDTPVEQHGISAQVSELLRLLVQGATDEQVARRLGVSMRTVRRIVAKLSGQVGASGRFELGVRAAQRGWVD